MPRQTSENLNLTKFRHVNSNNVTPHRSFFSSNPFLKTFNSLYDYTFDRTTTTSKSSTPSTSVASSDSEFSVDDFPISASTPDLTSVFASQRFFFSSPGTSNSIIDSSSSSAASSSSSPVAVTTTTTMNAEERESLVGSSVAVPTYSPDPYMDFRRSMQEMVDARGEMIDWDYLQDLLMCYLSLNPKSTHKFILGAFADLLVNLMTPVVVSGRV